MKKLCVLVMTLVLVFSMTATVSADANASWNAGKGTATVDGQKDDVYAGAQEMKMAVASDVPEGKAADDSAASAWAVYDTEAIYFFVEVSDSALDDTNANVWEKDSIELRIDNKDQTAQAYAVSETFDGTVASEVKVLKTDKGYNVEFKVPYATAEGSSMKFSLQVNCASDGARNNTLHTNDDLKDAWQNNDVFENLVFSAEAATTAEASTTDAADAPKTGVVSMGVIFGMGSIASMIGLTLSKEKKEK